MRNVEWYLLKTIEANHCFNVFSRNQLSVLPKFLFTLPLKVLVVSNNKLLSIPEEIGKAKDLMELVSMWKYMFDYCI